MDSYNRIVAMVGAAGATDAEFQATLINNHGFYDEDVKALCASPTVRQLMGW